MCIFSLFCSENLLAGNCLSDHNINKVIQGQTSWLHLAEKKTQNICQSCQISIFYTYKVISRFFFYVHVWKHMHRYTYVYLGICIDPLTSQWKYGVISTRHSFSLVCLVLKGTLTVSLQDKRKPPGIQNILIEGVLLNGTINKRTLNGLWSHKYYSMRNSIHMPVKVIFQILPLSWIG